MTMGDLALGIDSSTTAVKCVAWGRDGRAVAEGRADIPMENPAPLRYEQDPEHWWSSLAEAMADLGGRVDLSRIAGVAVSNQRETISFLDEDGEPVRPAMLWLDERCNAQVESLSSKVGADNMHRISGKHKGITPTVYRLAWLRENEPDNFAKTATFADVHAFICIRLSGEANTSWASADPYGCWDVEHKRWSADILGHVGLDEGRFPRAFAPGEKIGEVTSRAAEQTGIRSGTPVFAGGGDGQCAGLGASAISPDVAYLNLGTAVVSGAYSPGYLWGDAWRTMTALNDGYILEHCLRSGTFLLNWLVGEIFGLGDDGFTGLDQKAAKVGPGAGGLLLLPYWSGVMNPHWNALARGAILGVGEGSRREHLYRGVLEGIALEQAFTTDLIEKETGQDIDTFYAVGGGAKSDLWCGIIASATGKRVCRLSTVEASALGAGMCAASGLGWYETPKAAAEGMRGKVSRTFEPDSKDHNAYQRILEVYKDVYAQTEPLSARLREAIARG